MFLTLLALLFLYFSFSVHKALYKEEEPKQGHPRAVPGDDSKEHQNDLGVVEVAGRSE